MAAVSGAVPVVVGASDVTTAKTTRRARCVHRADTDAVMVLLEAFQTRNF
jgi:4-hydroxy-tetrahydrodipicolinate synthase